MPRSPRLDHPGCLQHVMARGIERRKIFRSVRDRLDFLDRVGELVTESGAGLYAWVLMPNHFHVLLRTGRLPLSRFMQRLLGPYATAFNRRHRRCGHLFQNRFKNTLVQEEPYLLELGVARGSATDLEGGGLRRSAGGWEVVPARQGSGTLGLRRANPRKRRVCRGRAPSIGAIRTATQPRIPLILL